MSPARARAAGLVLVALLAVSMAGGARGQTMPAILALEAPPSSAIFVPDGFIGTTGQAMDGVSSTLNELLRLSGTAVRLRMVPAVVNGHRLDWYDPMAFLGSRQAAPVALSRRPFDIAILDECLGCAEPSRVVRRQAEAARRMGAEPVLFMPWAPTEEATARIAEATTRAANAARAFVIPAGLAFARARAQRPGLELTFEDERTPTPAGSYLAAAIIYAALYGQSPEGIRHTGGLDLETAAFLQRVAWETAWEYFAGSAPPRS